MKIKNRHVEIDFPYGSSHITIHFTTTKAQITITPDETRALWRALADLFDD